MFLRHLGAKTITDLLAFDIYLIKVVSHYFFKHDYDHIIRWKIKIDIIYFSY